MKYEQYTTDKEPAMANEPVAAYSTTKRYSHVPICSDSELDNIFANLSDEQLRNMPCQFTDEELDEEIRMSEESGFISNDEVKKRFEQWGYLV